MQNDVFTTKEQIRKAGEHRYGKGTLTITDSSIILNYKKLLGKPEEYVIPREKIQKVEITKDGLPIEIYAPGLYRQGEQSWYIMDIKFHDGEEFNIFVGDLVMMPKKKAEEIFNKYKKIQEMLMSAL